MPIPQQRDMDEARGVLRDWLAKRLDAPDLVASPITTPGGTGYSSETLMLDARWSGGERGFVFRVEPTAHRIFLDTNFEPQYRIMRALEDAGDVPMPPMLWFESDPDVLGAPFYVMGKVDGRTPPDTPPYHAGGWVRDELSPDERAAMWWDALGVLARIHSVDPSPFVSLLDIPRRGATGIEQSLASCREWLAWAADGRPHAVAEEALAWLEANRPANEPLGLVWGDSRIGNMIFQGTRCAAVLDWEMVDLGSPEADLAWFLFLDRFHSESAGRLPGFPDDDETVARYEELTGRRIEHLKYYDVFAGLRFAIVMLRIAELMARGSDYGVNNGVTRLLAKSLERV